MAFRHFDHQDTIFWKGTTICKLLLAQLLTFLCSFHNKLKTNPKYSNHHVNRRCDDLIAILLSFEEDMYHDRRYLEIMNSPDLLSQKHDGVDHHKRGIGILDDVVMVILQLLKGLYSIHIKLCLESKCVYLK